MANTKTKEVKKENIDIEEIKKELKDYVTVEVKNSFNEELEKSNRRLIREKNKKIIAKNIVIVILLVIIGFLLFLLYDAKYFNKYFNGEEVNNKEVEKDNNENKEEKDEPKEPTLEEKIEEYSYLLDNIYMDSSSDYFNDYVNGKLTDEIKYYFVLNSISDEDINTDEEYSVISEDTFKKYYNVLFDDEFNPKSFKYNDNEIKYVAIMKSYISSAPIDKIKTNVDRMITDIKVEDDVITITTLEHYKEETDKLFDLVYKFNDKKLESFNRK